MYRIPKLVLVSMVIITLLGTFASPALANTIDQYDYDFADVWQPYTCANGQKIVEDYAVHVDVRNFYDKNGEFFMLEETVVQTGKIYLEDQPWKVIYYENEHWKNMLKPTGVNMSPGIIMKITIPGYGIIFQDIGRIVFEYSEEKGAWVPVWMAGHHEFIDPAQHPFNFNYAPACDYLTALP
jgi:hypothetical protein